MFSSRQHILERPLINCRNYRSIENPRNGEEKPGDPRGGGRKGKSHSVKNAFSMLNTPGLGDDSLVVLFLLELPRYSKQLVIPSLLQACSFSKPKCHEENQLEPPLPRPTSRDFPESLPFSLQPAELWGLLCWVSLQKQGEKNPTELTSPTVTEESYFCFSVLLAKIKAAVFT